MTLGKRKHAGSTFVLTILTICLVIVPAIGIFGFMGLCSVNRGRAQDVVDSAAIIAANDLSRIIIDDPNFGLVGLSNSPPIGDGTGAPDTEPCPVTGINTLIGTVRQNTILAHELGNETMSDIAAHDYDSLQKTVQELNKSLNDAVSPFPKKRYRDICGKHVQTYNDVAVYLQSHLPFGAKLDSIKLTTAWLGGTGRSGITLPMPSRLAQVSTNQSVMQQYRACIKIPACGKNFEFAPLGPSSTLVAVSQLRSFDEQHVCSIAKVECAISFKSNKLFEMNDSHFKFVSAGQPYSQSDSATVGKMIVRFAGTPTRGLQSWNDLLNEANFRDRVISNFRPVKGDFGNDADARMTRVTADHSPSTCKQFAECLYHWLRNSRLHPNMESVIAMINDPFQNQPNEVYSYQIAADGQVIRRNLDNNPYPIGVTSELQSCTICDTTTQDGATPLIIMHDNVATLGSVYGGKHRGQPINGALAVDIEIGGIRPSSAMMDIQRMRALNR